MLVDLKDPANKKGACLEQDPMNFGGFATCASRAYTWALLKCKQRSETGEDTCCNTGSGNRAFRSSDQPWQVSDEVW